ncbi:hypothetical protein [Streptomyces coeruleorubidus]|uniref:hypothetical protein n=1 Tax=Streptomyces coeruleorubidus TaxID=116188 RepID=UPI0033F33AF2
MPDTTTVCRLAGVVDLGLWAWPGAPFLSGSSAAGIEYVLAIVGGPAEWDAAEVAVRSQMGVARGCQSPVVWSGAAQGLGEVCSIGLPSVDLEADQLRHWHSQWDDS